MKERPILFTGEMVRAILDGRKTQMRRPVKPRPNPKGSWLTEGEKNAVQSMIWCEVADIDRLTGSPKWHKQAPPLGTVGDRLWVREKWAAVDFCDSAKPSDFGSAVWYQADNSGPHAAGAIPYKTDRRGKWRSPLHMPRWASRIDLEITAVRVERVQDITDGDAISEGCVPLDSSTPREMFAEIWQFIYGTWEANPWVWVYEFRRVKP